MAFCGIFDHDSMYHFCPCAYSPPSGFVSPFISQCISPLAGDCNAVVGMQSMKPNRILGANVVCCLVSPLICNACIDPVDLLSLCSSPPFSYLAPHEISRMYAEKGGKVPLLITRKRTHLQIKGDSSYTETAFTEMKRSTLACASCGPHRLSRFVRYNISKKYLPHLVFFI